MDVVVANLLVHIELAEDLGSVKQVGVVNNPMVWSAKLERTNLVHDGGPYFLAFQARSGRLRIKGTQ